MNDMTEYDRVIAIRDKVNEAKRAIERGDYEKAETVIYQAADSVSILAKRNQKPETTETGGAA
ncbi:MAG: hypothetical protein AAF429_14535 [Pseudomonadota bacterium]